MWFVVVGGMDNFEVVEIRRKGLFFLPLCGKFSRGCNANIVDKYTIERISLLHFFLSFFFDFLPCLKLVFKLEIFNIVMKLVMLYRESCAFV